MFVLSTCSHLVWKLTSFTVGTIIWYVVGLHLVQNLHVFSIHSHKAQTSGLWLYDSVMVCIVNMLIVKTVTHIAL